MYQAYRRGWKGLATSLVLVPGLTGLGAEALGLIGGAAAQERVSSSGSAGKAEEARSLMQQAREAYDRKDYGKSKELAEKARSLRAPSQFWDDTPEDLLADIAKKTGKPIDSGSAPKLPTDPRILIKMGRDALESGNLDRAQDMARRAEANAGSTRWGLFDDTPASLMKDIKKALGKRDREDATRMLAEARRLLEKPTSTPTERATNLDKARDLAQQAEQMHGSYNLWDLGDRPSKVLAEVKVARDKVGSVPSNPAAVASTTKPTSKEILPKNSDSKTVVKADLKTGSNNDEGVSPAGYNPLRGTPKGTDLVPVVPPTPDTVKGEPISPYNGSGSSKILPPDATPLPKSREVARENPAPTAIDPEQAAKRSKALSLMQESNRLQLAGKLPEARAKLIEASQLNASFRKDEDTPEMALQSLNVNAKKQLQDLCTEARSQMNRKKYAEAEACLDLASKIATGMNLDAANVNETRSVLYRKSGKSAPKVDTTAIASTGTKPAAPIVPVSNTTPGTQVTAKPVGGLAAPLDIPVPPPEFTDPTNVATKPTVPVVLPVPTVSGPTSIPATDIVSPIKNLNPISPNDPPPSVIAPPTPPAIKMVAAPEVVMPKSPNVKPLPDVTISRPAPIPEPSVSPPAGTPFPPTSLNGSESKNPSRLVGRPTKSSENPMPPEVDPTPSQMNKPALANNPAAAYEQGQELLRKARIELRRGETEGARRMVTQAMTGPYGVQTEAEALLNTIETEEADQRRNAARRAFENAVTSYNQRNYRESVAIFQQIDPSLLPPAKRSQLNEMMNTAMSRVRASGGDVVQAGNVGKAGSGLVPASGTVPAGGMPMIGGDVPNTATPRNGADNLLRQQEALQSVMFQQLRSEGLKVESEATARFGKGETDAALQDMANFITKVKSSPIDASKQAMLVRPIESRVERLKILKHQTDFLTTEASNRRSFKANMTQEALAREGKKNDVAAMMKSFHRLMDEAKYKEAFVQASKARELDPDDPATQAAFMMSQMQMRSEQFKATKAKQEEWNYEQGGPELWDFPKVNSKNPLAFTDDPERRGQIQNRMNLNRGVGSMRTRTEKEKEIERKLNTPVNVDFKNHSLDSVIEYFQTYTGVNFDLDERSILQENLNPKHPITQKLNNVSLKSALNIVLGKAGLTFVISNEAIKVTTRKHAQGQLVRKTLPVGDLVISVPNFGSNVTNPIDTMMRNAGSNVPQGNPTPFVPGQGLGGATQASMSTPGASNGAGRITNQPAGGNSWQVSNASGTMERELIKLVTSTIKPDSWASVGGEGTIEYYPLGLALVINQSPEVIEEVTRLLDSLRQLQDLEISIEVKMITLAETFYERIGLDFSMNIPTNNTGIINQLASGVPGVKGKVIGLQAPGVPTPDLDIPIRATSFGQAIPTFGNFPNALGADGGLSLGLAFLNDIQVYMFLEAAQGDRRTNVLQAPKLTMFNGQSANISINDQQFFVTGITVTSVNGQLVYTPQNNPIQLGVQMNMQPVVSGDRRFVRLNVQQTMTNLFSASVPLFPVTTFITPVFENGGQGQPIPFTQYIQQPSTSNLTITTTVVVPDGGTVVLGGLKTMSEGRNEFGPPVLSKIPYVNRLFKNVGYGREGQSLLLMVTPRIIINREEQEKQTGVREDVADGP